MTDPCELSAVEARRLIGEGALSPVELFDACQKRIEEINPAVNAVVAERFEAAVHAGEEVRWQMVSSARPGSEFSGRREAMTPKLMPHRLAAPYRDKSRALREKRS